MTRHILIFEFIKEAALFTAQRGSPFNAEFFFKLKHKLFLALGEVFGHVNNDSHKLIASASAAENLNTLALEAENSARLCACGDIKFDIAVKSGNSDVITESSLSVTDSLFKPDIIAVTLKI